MEWKEKSISKILKYPISIRLFCSKSRENITEDDIEQWINIDVEKPDYQIFSEEIVIDLSVT